MPISSSNVSKAQILTQNDDVPGSNFEQHPDNYTYTQLVEVLKLSGKQAHLILPVHDLSRANTMYLNRVQIRENALKENNLNRIHLKDLTVPEMPKSGSKVFPSQDVPSLFNDGLVYHYMLESPPVVEENINNTEDEEKIQDLDT